MTTSANSDEHTKIYTVYKITCIPNQRIYIGCTSMTPRQRFTKHRDNARANCDLKQDIEFFGEHKFAVDVLFQSEDKATAYDYEDDQIAAHGTENNPMLYNEQSGGLVGVRRSAKSRRKRSAIALAQSPEARSALARHAINKRWEKHRLLKLTSSSATVKDVDDNGHATPALPVVTEETGS